MEFINKKELNQLDFLKHQINSEASKESVIKQNKKIEKILILDTETTGLDENKDQVIEIGCILFDVSSKLHIHFLLSLGNLPFPNHFLSNSTL